VAQIDTNCGGTMVGPNGHPISQWNVEKVTAMNNLFAGCPGFNEDISDWDVSKVYTFEYMFLRTTAFNQPLGSWNTSKATDFWGMFLQATAFNQPLGSWNTEKATDFYYMFYRAEAFNQPLDSWNIGKATNFYRMFADATAFNQPLGSWNTSKALTFNAMFYKATAFNQPLGSWNTTKATDFIRMFGDATAFNQPLDSWNTEKSTNFYRMFDGATTFDQPLGSWNTEKGTDFYQMFKDTSVSIDTTAYWDTTNAQSSKYLSPQQPCPDGYDKSQTYPNGGANGGAQIGHVAVRCPSGCNVAAGYHVDDNGFCCSVSQCAKCATTTTCAAGQCNVGYEGAICTQIDCFTPVPQCAKCATTTTCAAGQCNTDFQDGDQCTACPNPGIGEKLTTVEGSCFVTPCPAVAGTYYTTNGDCSATENCPALLADSNEQYESVLATKVEDCTTECITTPGIGEERRTGSCFVTPCPAVAGEYYIKAGDCTKMSSCTKRDSNQYYDKNETITSDDCSVATCPTDQTPAADGLSCEDETKSKVSETGDDAMIGTIMISETGDDAMIGTIMIVGSVIGALVLLAVVGIVVFCVIKRKRKNKRRDLGNRESKFDVELEAVTNNDEPVSRPSPSIEYREKEL